VHFGEADAATLGVTEIAEELGLSKAVVHGILTSLRAKGFVELDARTRRYRLGPRVVSLGLAWLDRIDVRSLCRPVLAALCQATGETATLSIPSGWTRVYVDQVTPDRDVKMVVQVGRAFPLHAGASSKALLAFLDAREQQAYFDQGPLAAVTEGTLTDQRALRRELDHIREVGYAISFGERDAGAGSVAAPVHGPDRRPHAVISVAGPLERFRDEAERFTELVLAASRELTAQLGGSAVSACATLAERIGRHRATRAERVSQYRATLAERVSPY
jgi:DNA-binding IclR family transcriptional regulator